MQHIVFGLDTFLPVSHKRAAPKSSSLFYTIELHPSPSAQMPRLRSLLVLSTCSLVALATSDGGGAGTKILSPTYQSSHLTFNEWVTLYTLCLAPLIAHIVAGVPTIVYLSQDRPTWHQRLGLFNPTTILWRYFAIADRRLRAKRWSPANLSSSNVYFWTRTGWDGSEALTRKSQAYCILLPRSKHATLASWSTVKTIIVALQGADSFYYILWSDFGKDPMANGNNGANFTSALSVGTLFSPLAIFGLLRLVACFWLTEDFVYVNCEEVQTTVRRLNTERKQDHDQDGIQLVPLHIRARNSSTMIDELSLDLLDLGTGEDYRPPNTWPSMVLRTLFLLPIVALIILCTSSLVPTSGGFADTATVFGLLLFYDIFLVITLTVLGYYFIRGRNTTTVLPCTSSLWYQIYSSILFASMLVLVIIASLETWKSPCGFYTTFPSNINWCGTTISSAQNTTDGVFGVAVTGNMTTNLGASFVQSPEEMSILYFSGSCLGYFHWNDNFTGAEGFRFVNTSDKYSFL